MTKIIDKQINILPIMLRFLIVFCGIMGLGIAAAAQSIDPERIQIARDRWGVPHIFAPTDAEVAYGLAWANAEDSFLEMQEQLAVGKGFMGRWKSIEGAGFDFYVHSIDPERTYRRYIDSLSPDFLLYLDGYCQGINAYAQAHPEQVRFRRLFPVDSKTLLQTYVIAFSALGGAADQVENIVKGKYDAPTAFDPKGSNAYAFSSQKTDNGKTFLAINPHFQVGGAFSFYEAHLCSEAGLNITGALFQGGTSVFMGNNPYLGWGKTYNHMDLVDVFRLEMHPRKPLTYKIDGIWKRLEKRPVWLRVRLGKPERRGGLVLPVRKTTYWSDFGPTLRSPGKQFFALRASAFFSLSYPEQYYRMNRARNFEEFQKALDMGGITMFNIVYADREDNILYLCNGKLPRRAPGYDYLRVLPGDTSAHLWTEFYPWRELPHQINPECGFVYNTNNTPTRATCQGDTTETGLRRYADLRKGQNNRALRFLELAEAKARLSFEEFKAIKFDMQTSPQSPFAQSIRELHRRFPPEKHPALADALQAMFAWDGDGSPRSTGATFWILFLDYLFDKMHLSDEVFIKGLPYIDEATFLGGVQRGKSFLMKHYGRLNVPMGELQCHFRNGKTYCAPGFPDVLSPAYAKADPATGKYKTLYADTYIHFVEFGKEGAERIETLLPFETTASCEGYEDELQMLHRGELKTMSLDKETVLKQAVKVYTPKGSESKKPSNLKN